MDDEGFISIQYLFSIFLILTIAIGLLFFTHSTLQQSDSIQKQDEIRLAVDEVADEINQIISNGNGYSKIIEMPDFGLDYKIVVHKNYAEIESEGKVAKSRILDCNLVNGNGMSTDKIEMYSSNSYMISKENNLQIKRWYNG